MNRAERRAAERPTEQAVTPPQTTAATNAEPVADLPPKPPLSEARLEANRTNSTLHSTGPRTPEGKAISSMNAVKTGLTGRTILLPFEEAAEYQSLMQRYQKEFQPVDVEEQALVQSILDTRWRLDRMPALFRGLVTVCTERLSVPPLSTDPATLEMKVRVEFVKDFRNLELQENRLVRRREREMKELLALQKARKEREAKELEQAAQLAVVAEHEGNSFDPEFLGFVFSTDRFQAHMATLTPAAKAKLLQESLAQPPKAMATAA